MRDVVTGRPPYDRTAERPAWAALPAGVRQRIADLAGAPVVAAEPAGGGFTRGFAGLLALADGTGVFVKAASAETGPVAATSYRAEARVLRCLPSAVPAPRLRWADEVEGWVVVGIDPVPGRMPGLPWTADDVAGATRACEAAAVALEPAPPGLELTRLADDLGGDEPWHSWYRDVARGSRRTDLLSPWARSALPDLHALMEIAPAAIDGDAACHGDLRPDNMIVDSTGTVWICDWNWLSLGARWTDLVGLLITVHGGGGDAEAVLRTSWLLDGVNADAVDAWLALIAAFMCGQAGDERPAFASPWLGPHRAYFGTAALSWLELRRS
jgi:hypothetical protein